MPTTLFERMVYGFVTVVITVLGFVFYTIYVIEGKGLMESTGASTVLGAVRAQGGVYMFGRMIPLWALILIEIAFAFALESLVAERVALWLACRAFDPRETHPVIFTWAIIASTVSLMCPSMSFIAAFLYYPYNTGFRILTLLANWLKTLIFNFPFAFFAQTFFIQPFMRMLFRNIFSHCKYRKEMAEEEKKDVESA